MPVNISVRLPNEPGMADDADTERVTFTIANLRSINSKRLYALVDVEPMSVDFEPPMEPGICVVVFTPGLPPKA